MNVPYLYQPGELEGGVKRVTNLVWSLKVFNIQRSLTKQNHPAVMHYLHNGHKRSFVREELLVVPPKTELSPAQL